MRRFWKVNFCAVPFVQPKKCFSKYLSWCVFPFGVAMCGYLVEESFSYGVVVVVKSWKEKKPLCKGMSLR